MQDRIAEIIEEAMAYDDSFFKECEVGASRSKFVADQILALIKQEPVDGWIFTECEHYRGCENEALTCQKYVDGNTTCMRPATQAEVNANKATFVGVK